MTPPSGRVLLDTNIVIALLAGEGAVLSHLSNAAEVFLPATVLGELFFGAAKSGRPAENAAKVERLAARTTIIACDLDVAREFGLVKVRCGSGPIPWRGAELRPRPAWRRRSLAAPASSRLTMRKCA